MFREKVRTIAIECSVSFARTTEFDLEREMPGKINEKKVMRIRYGEAAPRNQPRFAIISEYFSL